MASVTITIPDALVPRLIALRALFPQHAALSDTDTFKAITSDYWRNLLAGYEAQKAADTARVAASNKALVDAAGIN